MLRSFFTESKSEQIYKLLTKINFLISSSSKNLEELSIHKLQLQKHLDSSDAVSERTRRIMRKTLGELNSLLDTDAMVDCTTAIPECLIQLPSATDLSHMTGMPAGGGEDQQKRLSHMSELVLENSIFPIRTTDDTELNDQWRQLFKLIDLGKNEFALTQLEKMSHTDALLQLVLQIHPLAYLSAIINHCISAQPEGFKRLNSDILIRPKTFELLIKDLASSLEVNSPVYLSFGLPSHHAFNEMGSGFCLFNKTALMMKQAELMHDKPLKFFIIGTDVNRDNGLCATLNHSMPTSDIYHVDVFDSRVYPRKGFAEINSEFRGKVKILSEGIRAWQNNQFNYVAVDLAIETRSEPSGLHPALAFALTQLQIKIKEAQDLGQQMMLLLPTGWDSHEEETASCGKSIGSRSMTFKEAKVHRFNNEDLVFFYEQVLQLYKTNRKVIVKIYWGLEGGYDRVMYENQIPLLLDTFACQLRQEPSANTYPIC